MVATSNQSLLPIKIQKLRVRKFWKMMYTFGKITKNQKEDERMQYKRPKMWMQAGYDLSFQRGGELKILIKFIKLEKDTRNTTTTKIAGTELSVYISTEDKEENTSNLPPDQRNIKTLISKLEIMKGLSNGCANKMGGNLHM